MEWFFLLIAYLPIFSIVVGFGLLMIGFILKKTNKKKMTGFFVTGGGCIGICLLVYGVFFLIGALGVGPVPN